MVEVGGVTGFFAYHAVPTNFKAISAFRDHVTSLWHRTLRRRSQKAGLTRECMTRITTAWLPKPRILHPWPSECFAVKHPHENESARDRPLRIWGGAARNPRLAMGFDRGSAIAHCRRPPLQELAHGLVAFQSHRMAIGLQCGIGRAGARQQLGACGPIRLIVGQPR